MRTTSEPPSACTATGDDTATVLNVASATALASQTTRRRADRTRHRSRAVTRRKSPQTIPDMRTHHRFPLESSPTLTSKREL